MKQGSQSKRHSHYEITANQIAGLVIGWSLVFFAFPLMGIEATVEQASISSVMFFSASYARAYIIRRIFNKQGEKSMHKEDKAFEELEKKIGVQEFDTSKAQTVKSIDVPLFKMVSDGGGGANYYDLPTGATQLLDLIEDRNMNGNIKDIFKACYRLGKKDGITEEHDLKKMVLYSVRELGRVTGRKDYIQLAKEIVHHHDNTTGGKNE